MAWLKNDRNRYWRYHCSACKLETNNPTEICPDCGQFQGNREDFDLSPEDNKRRGHITEYWAGGIIL